MYKKLFGHLSSIVSLSESLQKDLSTALVTKEFKKGTCLLNEGQISNYIFFIEKGLVKTFYIKDGTEICSSFIKENEVVISVKSFFTRLPGDEVIEALEDTTAHYLHYDDLQKIYQNHIEFNVIGRILAEKHYLGREERLFSMRKQTAQERFNSLLESHAEIVQRIPRQDIASYLGISVRTLSRIGPYKKGHLSFF